MTMSNIQVRILLVYYLQHERPCCIGYTNSNRRREFVYPIQHGREWVHWQSNFKNRRCLSLENQLSLCKWHAYDFSLCFLHELLISFLMFIHNWGTVYTIPDYFSYRPLRSKKQAVTFLCKTSCKNSIVFSKAFNISDTNDTFRIHLIQTPVCNTIPVLCIYIITPSLHWNTQISTR
jgi:hypothetical protein